MALRRLMLRDYAIVRELELDLTLGFGVLTGETGAGKSILIDALQLVLGGRGEAIVVREGASRCEVAAEFETPPHTQEWLHNAGFEAGETALLRRVVDASGRSRAWVNASPATMAQLRELGDQLIHIHGQHEWHQLTQSDAAQHLLDDFGGLSTTVVRQAHANLCAAQLALSRAQADAQQLADARERLVWQLSEIDKVAPTLGEWDELNARHTRAAHAQDLTEAANQALGLIGEAEPNATSLLNQAVRHLRAQAAHDAKLTRMADVLDVALLQTAETQHDLRTYLDQQGADPQALAQLEERVSAWVSTARRMRIAPSELAELAERTRAQLTALEHSTDLDALQKEELRSLDAYQKAAKSLSKERHRVAKNLAQAVTGAMQGLGMAGGRFEAALSPCAPNANGLDAIAFLISGHESVAAKPIGKIASGGELSRIALALAVVTSQQQPVGTLIFDEVDSGVGGAVAETVGRLMKQLGVDRQVLAVTHLPQVAACADVHLLVQKLKSSGGIESTVKPIEGEARVSEIARMLGGAKLSEATFTHASELLATASK